MTNKQREMSQYEYIYCKHNSWENTSQVMTPFMGCQEEACVGLNRMLSLNWWKRRRTSVSLEEYEGNEHSRQGHWCCGTLLVLSATELGIVHCLFSFHLCHYMPHEFLILSSIHLGRYVSLTILFQCHKFSFFLSGNTSYLGPCLD